MHLLTLCSEILCIIFELFSLEYFMDFSLLMLTHEMSYDEKQNLN